MSGIREIRDLLSRFSRDRRGTTAVTFAITAIPLFVVIGAAVDYTAAATRRTTLQAAADAAAVRGCKDIQTQSVAVAKTNMQNMFKAMFKYDAEFNSVVTTTVAAGTVKVTASTMYYTQLGSGVGLNNVPLQASSECEYANNTYEVALVMDNSGSMGESAGSKTKMAAARDSAKALVDALYSGPTSSSRVKMSIVPFTLSVNVGSSYRTATWSDTAAVSTAHWDNFDRHNDLWKPESRFTLFDELNIPFGGCFETRPGDFAVTDAGTTPSQPDSYFVPQFAPDDPGPMTSGSNNYNTGTGAYYYYENSYLDDNTAGTGSCRISGTNQPHATSNVDKALTKVCKYRNKTAASAKNVSNERGPNYMCNGQPLMRLTNDQNALKAKIDTMVAEGNTNIFEGFMWGWRTISPNGPFADGRIYGQQPAGQPNNVKVVIVLTDGINAWSGLNNPSRSRFSPAGFLQNTRSDASGFSKVSRFTPLVTTTEAQGIAAMDNRLVQGCTNAKLQGVIVYTIGFAKKESEVNSTVLKNCASPDQSSGLPLYYYAANDAEVLKVFKDIADRLSELRITK